MDVIRQYICPFLDCHGRINLNCFLKPEERIVNQINKDKIRQLEILINLNKINVAYRKLDNTWHSNTVREENFCELFETVSQNMRITQHNINLRTTLIGKITAYTDPECHEYLNRSETFKQTLLDLSLNILDKFNTKYPFLYALSVPDTNNWSAVDAGPHMITDNEKYLSAIKPNTEPKPKSRHQRLYNRKRYRTAV